MSDHRGADTAGHARGEHHLRRRGQARDNGGDAEDTQSGDEHGLAAQAVADGAERQQQRGQGKGVDVDDPQDRALGGAEFHGHAGLRDVQPGHRGDDRHQGDGDGDQDRAQLTRVGDTPAAGLRGLYGLVRTHGFLSKWACRVSAGAGPVAE
jgi:hypothetical protein